MTGRVCPVHGEWSATGVCRWCEEPTAKAKAARMKTLRDVYKLVDWRMNLRAPPSWRLEYTDSSRLLAANCEEEARLLLQHAALRWERVARRWAAKGKRWGTLQERFADWARAAYALHKGQTP